MKKKINTQETRSEEDKKFPGYPHYPRKEDIFEQDDTVQPYEEHKDDMGVGLDIPGAELDDKDEAIGEEDEENNYYSLGGDEHSDLEENEND